MNEKWFLLSVSEIEKKLNTNAASGLSRKAARSRLSAKYGTLFSLPVRSPVSYLGELVADFAYIMLMIMSFLALCFGENDVGIVATVVIVLNLLISFVTYYRSQFFCDSLERLFLPRSKVIREGRLYSVNATDVVRGDVILLEEGDIVPADARLVTSSNLRVKMLVEKNRYTMLDKAAEGIVSEKELDATRLLNMVHAASVVLGGSARAIVTDVGQYTYVGARIGEIPSESRGRRRVPELLRQFKKYCSRLSFISMVTVLPFSILSMLLGNTTLSLFSAFMTAIAVAASSMSQLSVTVCKAFYTTSIKRCLSAYEPSLVRSPYVADTLASARYLFVLDSAVATDGVLHFERSVTVDGERTLKEGEHTGSAEKKLGELASLYDSAKANNLSLGTESNDIHNTAIKEFIDKISADKGALKIRCNVTGFIAASKKAGDLHDRLFYTEFGERYMLCVSYTDSIIDECAECMSGNSKRIFSSAEKSALMSKYRAFAGEGKSVAIFTVTRHDGAGTFGNKCFVGMIVSSERYDAFAKEDLDKLSSYGLNPIFFRNTVVDGKVFSANAISAELAGEKCVSLGDFSKRSLSIAYGLGRFACYSSLSDRDICELIDAAHAAGEKVAVCGFNEKYERVYAKADLIISFCSDKYKVKGRLEEEIDVLKSHDDPSRKEVSEMQRRRADILIPRPDKDRRGGAVSLLSAYYDVVSACVRVVDFFRYAVYMQIIRLVLVMMPMLFGSTALDAKHVLFGGMIADFIVMFAYMTRRNINIGKSEHKKSMKELASPLSFNASGIICFSASALIASLLPELMELIPGVPKYIDKAEYSLVIFVLFHIVAYLCLVLDVRIDRLKGIKQRLTKVGVLEVVYPLFMIAFVFLSFLSPYLSALLGIQGFSSPVYLFIAFLPPIASAVAYFFFSASKIEFNRKYLQ